MPRFPMKDRLRSRLTFSNAVSLIALFVALGGSAYASGLLPPNSVGRAQLQPNSVTSSKLAPSSVGRSELRAHAVTSGALAPESVGPSALTPALRELLSPGIETSAEAGPQGPTGSQGPAGPTGPAGPGAIRVRYFEHAAASPTGKSAIAIPGFQVDGQCQTAPTGTQLNLSASTAEAGTFIENINADGGPGNPISATASSSNLQADLPAGTTVLGGPAAATGEYARIFVQAIYVTPAATTDLTLVLLIDGTAGTCAIDGVGVPATS
jgi:hypothetical protein